MVLKSILIKIYRFFLIIIYLYPKFIFFIKCKFLNIEYEAFPKISGFMYITGSGKIKIGKNVKLSSGRRSNPLGSETKLSFIVSNGAKLTIGNNCGISNSTIFCTKSIIIEDNVLIGGGTKIYDTDFHPLDYYARINNINENISRREVIIKEGAFIGGHSIILKGVKIGKRSIIGAGSVVSKDIPDFEIWAGNPAQFIKKI